MSAAMSTAARLLRSGASRPLATCLNRVSQTQVQLESAPALLFRLGSSRAAGFANWSQRLALGSVLLLGFCLPIGPCEGGGWTRCDESDEGDKADEGNAGGGKDGGGEDGGGEDGGGNGDGDGDGGGDGDGDGDGGGSGSFVPEEGVNGDGDGGGGGGEFLSSEEAVNFLAEEGIYLPVRLCLLGSTGSGKSALGNFILDPLDSHIFEEQTFLTGETSESCTSECKVADHGSGVVIVDTPGFNESHSKDLGHMIGVARSLSGMQTAHAVVLVKKYDARLDQPWRDTVLYYKELLGPSLQQNLVVVLTGYSSLPSRRRKAFGDLSGERIAQTAQEIQALLDLESQPPIFLIDAMPEHDDSWKKSLEVRQSILRHCARQRPVPLDSLRIPKTLPLRQQDETEAGCLEGQIKELQVRVKNLKVFAWSKNSRHPGDLQAAQQDLAKYLQEACNDPEIEAPLDELSREIEEKRARVEVLRSTHMTLDEAERRSQLLLGGASDNT